MYNEPWVKLTTFSTPKISVSPAATRNSSMPMIRPPVAGVTRQAEEERQVASVRRSMMDRSRRGTMMPTGYRVERAGGRDRSGYTEHDPEEACPDLIQGGNRPFVKIMLHQRA